MLTFFNNFKNNLSDDLRTPAKAAGQIFMVLMVGALLELYNEKNTPAEIAGKVPEIFLDNLLLILAIGVAYQVGKAMLVTPIFLHDNELNNGLESYLNLGPARAA